MPTAITHLAIVVACSMILQTTTAQELNPDHVVTSVLQDSKGLYWFGTRNNGVYKFDGHDLTLFTQDDGLVNNQVRNMLEGQNGMIWFETASGINRYDGQTISSFSDRDFPSADNWQLKPDDLWFKGDHAADIDQGYGVPGVYRYDGTTFRNHAFPTEVTRNKDGVYSVTGIDQGKIGTVWIATYAAVIGFDGENFVTIDDESLDHTEDTGYLHARCVFEDSKGRLWIGNNGIGVILREGNTTTNFTLDQGVGRRDPRVVSRKLASIHGDAAEGEPSLHRVFSIGEDRDGNIWFGTIEQGAWRFDGTSLRQFTESDGLHTKQVMVIYTDNDGDLWLGGNGLFKFNGEMFEQQL